MKHPIKNFIPKKSPHGSITQYFGENPILYSRFGFKAHNGIDIIDEWDAPIYSVEDGIVVDVKREPDGYGRHIRILSGENLWVYGHLEQQSVTVGDTVKAGQPIGTMGNTGFVVSSATAQAFWGTTPAQKAPGTHLHLGVRKVVRDPKGFSYPKSRIKIRVLNYGNGYKGAVDPLPILVSGAKTPSIENLETQVSLLRRVVELLTQLKSMKP
jgi:murein DD-endopeptidase MepM/ murein hydrolase activator NlpD